MNKHIQIRNIEEGIHRKLKMRAAAEGMSLSDYLKLEFEKLVSRPTMKEWLEKVKQLEPIELPETAAEMIRHERDSR